MPAICKILLMSVLAVCTLMDVRSHTVSLPVILGGCIAAIVVNRTGELKAFREMLIGLLPGVFLLIAAWLSREKIGSGDGFLFLFIGLLCGLQTTVSILFIALVLSLVVGSAGILILKKPKGTAFPFVPFVLAAALAMLIGTG